MAESGAERSAKRSHEEMEAKSEPEKVDDGNIDPSSLTEY